jgi:hypothetical protein
VFERCHRNKREACQALGISYHTLQAYLRMPTTAGHDEPNDESAIGNDSVASNGHEENRVEVDV